MVHIGFGYLVPGLSLGWISPLSFDCYLFYAYCVAVNPCGMWDGLVDLSMMVSPVCTSRLEMDIDL